MYNHVLTCNPILPAPSSKKALRSRMLKQEKSIKRVQFLFLYWVQLRSKHHKGLNLKYPSLIAVHSAWVWILQDFYTVIVVITIFHTKGEKKCEMCGCVITHWLWLRMHGNILMCVTLCAQCVCYFTLTSWLCPRWFKSKAYETLLKPKGNVR